MGEDKDKNQDNSSGSEESVEELHKALDYYKKQTDKLSAENIKNDAQLTKTQNELKQRKEALKLLVELQAIIGGDEQSDQFISGILHKVSSSMKLDLCGLYALENAVLTRVEVTGLKQEQPGEKSLSEKEIGQVQEPVLVNKATEATTLIEKLREFFGVKFFITVLIQPVQKHPYLLVAGRQKEIPPFYPSLNEVDIHTIQAIGSFLRANVDLYELHQETLKQEKEKQELIRRKKEELEELVEQRTQELSRRNDELEQAYDEIETQRDNLIETNQKLEATLKELQSTQEKLIQKEKMASLGQLTAGIAHEIKNPLNFVNNFSDLGGELVKEVLEEIEKIKEKIEQDDYDYIIEIMQDLESNINRINEHGSRADSIVKGMLQHSRGEGGETEKTDINKMVSEYTDLAYHGMRANTSAFNAEIIRNLDDKAGEVEVVPQDMSRALLNIINNGLQAAWEYCKTSNGPEQPVLEISTKSKDKGITIIIKDNGPGIPEGKRDKIFEPFYTTKPTGEGTGLGLSMAYDIINAHDGDIELDTQSGEYTRFKIFLPIN